MFSIGLALILSPIYGKLALAQSNSSPIGKIVDIANGAVLLQRQGWSEFHPTSKDTLLYPGDSLKLSRGVKTIVLCYANHQTWRVPEGISGANNGCPSTSQKIFTPSGYIGPTRSSDSSIPDIITPRKTALLNNKPRLRWHPVLGATSYIVTVTGTGGVDWQQEVNNTEIVYAGDQPLQPGGRYLLTVKVIDNQSESKEVFTLLKAEDAQRVSMEIEQIVNQDLPNEAKTLAIVDIYQKNKLFAEAIEKLEDLSRGSKIVAVEQNLGDLYIYLGLVDISKK